MKKLLPPASSFMILLQFGLFAEFTAVQLTMKWLLHTKITVWMKWGAMSGGQGTFLSLHTTHTIFALLISTSKCCFS